MRWWEILDLMNTILFNSPCSKLWTSMPWKNVINLRNQDVNVFNYEKMLCFVPWIKPLTYSPILLFFFLISLGDHSHIANLEKKVDLLVQLSWVEARFRVWLIGLVNLSIFIIIWWTYFSFLPCHISWRYENRK